MLDSFYSDSELASIGFKSYGENVLISRKASIYSPELISFGNNIRLDDFCILSGNISFGSCIHISAYCALYGRFGIEMENYSGLSPRCTVFSASDDFSGDYLIGPMVPSEFTNVTGGKVLIKRFVQVGAGTFILPDLTINEGVAVGSMSLVRKSLDEWSIYAGNPLRFIKARARKLLKYYDQHL